MSELKPCPFCGGEAITTTFIDPDDFEYMPIEVNDCDAEVTCENERCINGWWLSPKDWNTRPIEDALTARIAELEAENERLSQLLHDEMSQLEIATDLGNKRWIALNEIYEKSEKHSAWWCKRKAQEGLGIK